MAGDNYRHGKPMSTIWWWSVDNQRFDERPRQSALLCTTALNRRMRQTGDQIFRNIIRSCNYDFSKKYSLRIQ